MGKGEIYPLKGLEERNNLLEQIILERTRELEKTNSSLKDSETRYRRLFEAAKDGILILDAETGMIVDVNPYLLNILGYSHEQFLGKKVWELGFLKDVIASQDKFLELKQKGYVRYEDIPLEASDGRQIDVEFVSNVYDVDHQHVIQCNIRDISARKKEEAKAAQLAAIVESSDEVIISTTLDGVILSWNAGAEKIYGYKGSEILGKPISILFPSDRPNEKEEVLEKIRSGQRFSRFESVRQGKNGQLIDMSLTVSPIRDKEGNIIGVSTIGSDITDRKRAENALRESERRFHRLFDVSPDAFLVFDPFSDVNEWPIVDCNESACKMNGYTREELIGKSIGILDPAHETAAGRAAYLDGIQRGEILRFEAIHRHRDGHLFPIEVSNSIMTFQGRELVLGIDRDITERKRAEEALRESEQRFHRLFSASPDALMLLDPSYDPENWLIVDCNERACQMNGYTREELVGKSNRYSPLPR